MTPVNVEACLARVGYEGSLEPTLETLTALHRAHLQSVPYENLDIHLGRALVLDEERVFDKLVFEERGGWCYEMSALFARAPRTRFQRHAVGRMRDALEP